jgi:predicted phosphodiesterase
MRWAVVSDIHGNLPALEAVIADIAAARVDQIANLGDILSGPLWPAETADRLIALGWPTIAGNHERQLLADRKRMSASDRHAAERLDARHFEWIASLPKTLWLADDLYACHGTPTSDLAYFAHTVTDDGLPGVRVAAADEAIERAAGIHAAMILCGHTHLPCDLPLPDGRRIVNPGSVGLQAYDDDHPHEHVNENGSPHARYALIERVATAWRVELRQVAYDWPSAACQAERNGRGDWADALRTGQVGRRERDVIGR